MLAKQPRILLGVTSDASIRLMEGFPQHLAACGWDVHVVCAAGPLLDKLELEPQVTTHALAMSREPAPFADLRSLFAWILLLRKVRPDVLSVGTPKAGLLGGLAGVFSRVPRRVYLLRGLRLETVTGAKRILLKLLERVAMGSAHSVISVSSSLRDEVIKLGIVSKDKIVVLGAGSSNGVDLDAFDSSAFSPAEVQRITSQLALGEGVPVIGFVGRLTTDKGLDILASAREILAERGIDHQLLVVGRVEMATGDADAVRLGTAGRPVLQTGHVADPAIYYQLMDVLCLPTRREGFPNVVLEASAAGVPSVTTNATGAIDSVVDGVTGVVVEVGDARALAEGLSTVLSDRELRVRMGYDAHRRAADLYSREIVWARSADFYARLLEGSARTRLIEVK
ncbi:MAG: glycosyltransferase family 4 protein [Actinomycetales bacterium]|nr:glycosyltransferase family 4 protein [Actinomycetales bacterium]